MKTQPAIPVWKMTFMFIFVSLFSISFLSRSGNPVNGQTVHPTGPGTTHSVKYLDLPIWQLKLLGIECNRNGIFYKNQNPDRKNEKKSQRILCFYLNDETYCSNLNIEKNEEIKDAGTALKILKKMQITSNSFDPVMITDLDGHRTWDAFTVLDDKSMKLLPIRINTTDLQMQKRKDMVVFWFRPTESLKKALSEYVNIDYYLVAP